MSQAEPLSQDQAAARDPATAATRNVLVVGVGGQGVIMISKVLALVCQMQGYSVKQSEVHGMAKRGGSVFSHVRYGGEVWSPTIPQGEADVLLALEWAEGLRWLPYLRPETGVFISDTQQVVPPFACRNRSIGAELAYAKETPARSSGSSPRAMPWRPAAWPTRSATAGLPTLSCWAASRPPSTSRSTTGAR